MNKINYKKQLLLAYDIIFCILALVAVYIAICDITTGCSKIQHDIDSVITLIFIIDYFARLVFAASKKSFIKANVLDLIAIIPFNSLFKFFRVLKVLRILKLLKLAKVSAYIGRLYKHIKFFLDINGLKYMIVVCVMCILLGGVTIHFVEGMSFADGLWWSFVTATTVGYGDISPVSSYGRIVAAILMLVGIGLIGSLTSTITALFFERHDVKKDAKSEIIKTIQGQLDNFDSLTDEDIEDIYNTLKALHGESKNSSH